MSDDGSQTEDNMNNGQPKHITGVGLNSVTSPIPKSFDVYKIMEQHKDKLDKLLHSLKKQEEDSDMEWGGGEECTEEYDEEENIDAIRYLTYFFCRQPRWRRYVETTAFLVCTRRSNSVDGDACMPSTSEIPVI